MGEVRARRQTSAKRDRGVAAEVHYEERCPPRWRVKASCLTFLSSHSDAFRFLPIRSSHSNASAVWERPSDRVAMLRLLLLQAAAAHMDGVRAGGVRMRCANRAAAPAMAAHRQALPKVVVFDLDGCLWYPDM
eukprot:scaffold9119_cov32-Tisochrysis_lutea.AAC.3